MEQVSLSDIEQVSKGELKDSRLDTLIDGYSSFDEVLRSSSDPIALSRSGGKPYSIIDGRHRVFLAHQKGLSFVPATFVDAEKEAIKSAKPSKPSPRRGE